MNIISNRDYLNIPNYGVLQSLKSIRIANGQGLGDSIDAPEKLIQYGDIDYLTLDYLAEVTLSIMQRQKLKNPELGYALDFVDLIDNNLELVIKNKLKSYAILAVLIRINARKSYRKLQKRKILI